MMGYSNDLRQPTQGKFHGNARCRITRNPDPLRYANHCNALEIVVPERRASGFTTRHLHCLNPDLAPMVGYARLEEVNYPALKDGACESPHKPG